MIYSGDESCPPFEVLHGIAHYTNPPLENGDYPIDTMVTITCNEGYEETNPGASRVCSRTGIYWSGQYRMTCLRKKINKL